MYGCAFIYSDNMYRWHGDIYTSMSAIGYMCCDCSMCMYLDTSKLQINVILVLMFHNITIGNIYMKNYWFLGVEILKVSIFCHCFLQQLEFSFTCLFHSSGYFRDWMLGHIYGVYNYWHLSIPRNDWSSYLVDGVPSCWSTLLGSGFALPGV